MGPEGLYNVLFSPVVLVSAIFGGSSTAISYVLVASYFICCFTLMQCLHRYMGIGFLGACAGASAYLLNGFALANLSTAIGQPYFLAPVLLLALMRIAERATIPRIFWAGLVQAGMFSITIFPPMVLTTLACYSVALLANIGGSDLPFRHALKAAVPQLAVLPIGLGMVAFLYLPILEAQLWCAPIGSFYRRVRPHGPPLQYPSRGIPFRNTKPTFAVHT